MKNKLISVFIIIVVFMQGVVAFADGGKVGDNVSWNFGNGILEISGYGEMPDYKNADENPLKDIKDEVKKIVISEGITYIGNWNFADFKNAEEIIFPNTLEVIGERAFYNCSSIRILTLPEGLKEIKDGAFNSCTSIVRINLPKSLEKIRNSAFMNLPKLTAITIPQNVKSVGKWAFFGCTSLSGIYITGGVFEMGSYLFADIADEYTIFLESKSSDEWIEKKYFEEENVLVYRSEVFIPVYMNDSQINFDSAPVIIKDRTLVPVRAIFEAMDVKVKWDEKERKVTATKGDVMVTIKIDENVMYKNGKEIIIDVPATIINSRTYVPARAVSEAFDAKVSWNNTERAVYIEIWRWKELHFW